MAKNSKSSAKAAKQPKTNAKAAGKNSKGGKDQKVSFFGRIKQFFKDLRSEIKKIVWSSGKDTLKNGDDVWYSTYVDYAIANDIIGKSYGELTDAQMNAAATRSEFVAIFHGAKDFYAEKNTVADNAIPDVKMTDKNADAIYTFYRAGILTGTDGKRYIDMGSGIAVNSFGIADEAWMQAVTEQLGKVQHMSNLYSTEPCGRLAELLCTRTGMAKVFFCNSGAEANECAIKVARKHAAETHGADPRSLLIRGHRRSAPESRRFGSFPGLPLPLLY